MSLFYGVIRPAAGCLCTCYSHGRNFLYDLTVEVSELMLLPKPEV